MSELILRFPTLEQVVVEFNGEDAEVDFASPLSEDDLKELRWYLEVYTASYSADVDDARAQRIASQFTVWGTKLYQTVFQGGALERFIEFRNSQAEGRRITIRSSHPAVLSLPWELLHAPQGGYLFSEGISIRRNLGKRGGRSPNEFPPKERLRLLFVVSRPDGAGFLNPRLEPQAVMGALSDAEIGQVDVEFLRPATLQQLTERLTNRRLPPIDILHFDGHGVFDAEGTLWEKAKQALPPQLAGLKIAEGTTGKNTGYLLFEDANGKEALIDAERLGQILNQKQVRLVVLSACQSASVAGDEPFGSVAARLTQTGIPAILAMPYSVLITTTRQLFAEFYKELAAGNGIGESLDYARLQLLSDRYRGDRTRGLERVKLNLEDWFVPTLYQATQDIPLLQTPDSPTPIQNPKSPIQNFTNLPPAPEVGFFGRTRELWLIERAFVQGTRRFTVHGFGGQGKTALAQEAGRWLLQTGLFDAVCFVDYAQFQGVDAVSLAVATLAATLQQNLLDAAAATALLQTTATLLILDNLESIEPEPLRELLDAAKAWSEARRSRLLLTTRSPDFGHVAYATSGTRQHLTLPLAGLGTVAYPEDALDYIRALMALSSGLQPVEPPPRQGLIALCQLVEFHPLSLSLLARQLVTQRVATVGQALERLLDENRDVPDKDRSLIASLQLSLQRLDSAARQWLPRLGVFQSGAFEDDLMAITEVEEVTWQPLRQQLEATGLIQVEMLPGVKFPYLKFHPTLAPALWAEVPPDQQPDLLSRHRRRYYELSDHLYWQDRQNPDAARAIARRELPNLMAAAKGAIAAQDEWAIDFVNSVSRFLGYFGLNRDRAALSQQTAALTVTVGSQAWYLARTQEAEQLRTAGRTEAAAQQFEQILAGLGSSPSFKRCQTLDYLGRCQEDQRQLSTAAQLYRLALDEADQLEASDSVKRQKGWLQTDLADVLTGLGDYPGAKAAYETALVIDEELGDLRGAAIDQGQLGTLALVQNNLTEAAQRYQQALATFQRLHEPANEAVYWHQLGRVYQEAQQWPAAEQAYRRSAELKEALGMIGGANGVAGTWSQLAIVNELSGNPQEAEAWYRKALVADREAGDLAGVSMCLSNLASLLCQQPDRLPEAQPLAEESLAIKQTLDPAAAQIWKTYTVLANICEAQQQPDPAQAYRRLARQSKAAFAGTRHELQPFAPVIADAVAAVTNSSVRQQLEAVMETAENQNLVAAIRQIWAGKRDEDTLCAALDLEDSMVVMAILAGIADPTTLPQPSD